MSANAPDVPKGRLRQIAQAYRITKKSDPSLPIRLLVWFVVVGAVAAMAEMVLFRRGTISIIFAVIFGILAGILAVMVVL
ncbi:MAG TPA: DUF4191 family protein, partial [Aeromicrobium sp.]|nr:DUF4191 family protein [Aeromicrobium sp.]